MKKLLIILVSTLLFACSSTPSMFRVAATMPKDQRSLILDIPSTNNLLSNGIGVLLVKNSGNYSTEQLIFLLSNDNLNIGLSGNSQAMNKAVAVYGLNNAPSIGKNVSLYMFGDSPSDKEELEQLAKTKNVELHYFLDKKE